MTTRRAADVPAALGTAPDSWGVWFPSDPHQVTWQVYLDETVEAGYTEIELGPYGFLPTDAEQLRDELGSRGLTPHRRRGLRRAAPRRAGLRGGAGGLPGQEAGCSPRSAPATSSCCRSSTPTCTAVNVTRGRAGSSPSSGATSPAGCPGWARRCARSSGCPWTSTRTPTATSAPRSRSSGSSPTPTRRGVAVPGHRSHLLLRRRQRRHHPRSSPTASAMSTSSRSTPQVVERVRADGLSFADAVQARRHGRTAPRRARNGPAARRPRASGHGHCSRSSSRISTPAPPTSPCPSPSARRRYLDAAASARRRRSPPA